MTEHRTSLPLAAIATAVAVAALLFVAVVFTAYRADTGGEPRTIRGLHFGGYEVGNLTHSEFEAMTAMVADDLADDEIRVDLPDGPRMLQAVAVGIGLDEDEADTRAFEAGRVGGSWDRFRSWLGSFTSSIEIPIVRTFDEAAAMAALSQLDELIVTEPIEPQLVLASGAGLAIRPGTAGLRVDLEETTRRLSVQTEAGGPFDVDAPTVSLPPEQSDDELLETAAELNELTAGGAVIRVGDVERTLPEAALRVRIDTVPGGDGRPDPTFDEASLQRLLEHTFGDLSEGGTDPTFDVLDGEPEVVTVGEPPVICCEPNAAATIAEAIMGGSSGTIEIAPRPSDDPREEVWATGEEIVGLVAEFTTEHPCCQARVDNIQKFADLVRGVYLKPGESLSLNEHVGERTTEAGFQPAGTIIRGHLVPTVGGGVSQFATTMFNAAFFAGFDFVTYQSHSLYFSRYPYGREATISWPAPDLEFTNTTDYPALIWTSYTDTSITVSIYSTKSVTVEQIRQETSPARQCTRVDTFRERIYEDGRTVEDSVFATYRPGEGIDCNGNATEEPNL